MYKQPLITENEKNGDEEEFSLVLDEESSINHVKDSP